MSALKLCPTCGAEYPANERFCPKDGSALKAQGGGTDLVGSIIADRYHVLKKLGEGGMGQVYLAEHVKMGRRSAVKVMNAGMVNDADAITRFNREASNASRINHQHVAGIYDFGETDEGLIYLAMEYVEGEPLTELVQRSGALSPMRAAELTRQTGEALAVAHDMGIVHRDLKPDNIMVARNRDGSDCVKVVDFGIAKAANVESQKVTRTGLVVGTPEYMSPEQLAGDPLDGRSDIYSLGLVAFNMLTGRLPFPSETVQESMIMRLTDRPKRLAEMRPEVSWPPAVQAVMDRALERDAGARHATASEFGRALVEAVRGMPETAAAPVAERRAVPATAVAGAAVPATRVQEPSARPMAPASAAVAEPARRVPMRAGLAVLSVIAVAAAAGIVLTSNRNSSAAIQTAGQAGAARLADSAPAPRAPATVPLSTPLAVTGSRPAPALPVEEARAPAPQAGVTGAASGKSYASELLALGATISDSASAVRVESMLPGWRGKVTLASDSASLQFVESQAAIFTQGDARACVLIRRIRRENLDAQWKHAYNEGMKSCEGT